MGWLRENGCKVWVATVSIGIGESSGGRRIAPWEGWRHEDIDDSSLSYSSVASLHQPEEGSRLNLNKSIKGDDRSAIYLIDKYVKVYHTALEYCISTPSIISFSQLPYSHTRTSYIQDFRN